MEDLRGFDTNILVYAYNKEEGEKHVKSLELLERLNKGEFKGVLSVQNLNELFYVITKKGIKNIYEASIIVDSILNNPNKWVIKEISIETTKLGITLTSNNNKDFWDNLILANLILNGIKEIYTEDVSGFNTKLIKVINPFK